MSTIGFIGSGNIGGAIARLAVAAGYDVVLSNSRGPESLAGLVADLGPRANAGTPAEAAAAGDLVVVAVPLPAYASVPVEALHGKVVVDRGNYFPERFGQVPALDAGTTTTSQLLQDRLPGSSVVKAFSNISFTLVGQLPRAAGDPARSALPIAGDDGEAKAEVARVVDDLGFDAVDVGVLADGWRFERGQPAFVAPYNGDEPGVWPPLVARPVGREALDAVLLAAARAV